MNSATQHRRWIIGIHGAAAGTALALAIILVPVILATRSAQAQTYTESVLYSFAGSPDGEYSTAGLVLDRQGNLYGTTFEGGPSNDGTVFKVDTTGNETVLYSLVGSSLPRADLVLDAQGNLYGTASGYYGTVFKVDANGNGTVLYSFTGGTDGDHPGGAVVLDAQGNLYSTTASGGSFKGRMCGKLTHGCGTVFKVDTTGNETVLHSFGGGADGRQPMAGLVLDTQGNLYGTTYNGGGRSDRGTVFKVDTTGDETVLHSFAGGADGMYPMAGLVLDMQGNLYGTTSSGGASNCGTVFKVDTTGDETVLHSFAGGKDGRHPVAGLVLDMQGNLYGTTSYGGASNQGTVFKLDTTGNETVLYSFSGNNGETPDADLLLDSQGNLYGTTLQGGVYGFGIVFKLTPAETTTTMLRSSPNPSTYRQAVTFTAVVGPAPLDGETISFMKGKTVLGTGSLSGGSATFTTSTLKVGTTSVTAAYGGDSNFGGSKSNVVKQVVEKAEE